MGITSVAQGRDGVFGGSLLAGEIRESNLGLLQPVICFLGALVLSLFGGVLNFLHVLVFLAHGPLVADSDAVSFTLEPAASLLLGVARARIIFIINLN